MPPSSWSQSAATTARSERYIASFSESSFCAKSHTGGFWGAVGLPVSGRGEARVAPPCPTTLCVWRRLPYLTLPYHREYSCNNHLGAPHTRQSHFRSGVPVCRLSVFKMCAARRLPLSTGCIPTLL